MIFTCTHKIYDHPVTYEVLNITAVPMHLCRTRNIFTDSGEPTTGTQTLDALSSVVEAQHCGVTYCCSEGRFTRLTAYVLFDTSITKGIMHTETQSTVRDGEMCAR